MPLFSASCSPPKTVDIRPYSLDTTAPSSATTHIVFVPGRNACTLSKFSSPRVGLPDPTCLLHALVPFVRFFLLIGTRHFFREIQEHPLLRLALMTELTFDVSAPPVAGYYLLTGGSDGIYLFFKFSPRPGFSVVKVTHGISTLWESEDTLISVTIHRLGNLPVGLAIQLSDSALYFCYENFFWHPIGEEVYREKLRLDIHRCNFGKFGLDLSNVDTQDVTTVPVHDGTFLTTLFKPKRGNILISVRDGSQILWQAKGNGDKCLLASSHEVDRTPKFVRLALLESNLFAQRFFEKVDRRWVSISLHAYFAKRAPKDAQVTTVDLSTIEHSRVFMFKGVNLGLPYDVFFSSFLGKVVKIIDSGETLWEAKGGEKVIYAAVDHEKSHAHLTLLNSYGSSELCFEKRSGTWEAVEDIPGKFKILTH
ncbi:hypothetical protein BEWA_023500 [Theileria equi strain WA]|uniref:Uncharacterized protein n=1 Tax=Theileria equi strain WA TaxID=1537102 RepID=L0AWV8_THEEQ|nr:hypothetical protein BEWA_023500 [Theileria equi strain WA]AFZ79501.1 hypothetical protein BEWA_023500 [Theileria equi strain WA]|eukprot:XP_004829167.1 hypothetical protein BEWA_023500 [Theileria equi strain WA]